jgi:DNA recombination-dependent growth factor C
LNKDREKLSPKRNESLILNSTTKRNESLILISTTKKERVWIPNIPRKELTEKLEKLKKQQFRKKKTNRKCELKIC